MGVIQFDIRHPNGQREAIVVEGERAIVGSGAHCDVRLPIDQAAYEHVLIEVIGGSVRAEAKAAHPPATINNMPLEASAVAPDSVLGVGRVSLFVAFVSDATVGPQVAGAPQKKESKPAVQLGLIAAFGVAAFVMLQNDEVKIAEPPSETPVLFTEASPPCPRTDPIQAVAFGQEQMDLAHGKRERMPFSVSDGVVAVDLYGTAESCFKRGGAETDAADAADARRTLKEHLSNDFRARRMRLDYTLRVKDYELARNDVGVLLAMTQSKKGPYVEWLTTTQKQLPAPVKRKKKRKQKQ
jgi:hypothetical protein